MVLSDVDGTNNPPIILHENLGVANAFALCDRDDGGDRDVWAEVCPDGGYGTYGRGWLSLMYI